MIEPTYIHDTYTSGIANIENLGSAVRFVLYVDSETLGVRERLVVAKIIVPREGLQERIQQAAAVAGGDPPVRDAVGDHAH